MQSTVKTFDNDHDDHFDRLVGRDKEYQCLIDLLVSTSSGGKNVALVSGAPGVGKSHLIRSLAAPVTEMGGMFAEGKCDQFHESAPYNVIKECIGRIVDKIMTLPDSEIERVRSELESTLGVASSALLKMIPAIEPLINNKTELNPEDSFDYEATFTFATLQCIRIFQEYASPLVLFIDDIQWIDSPSMNIINMILDAVELNKLMIVMSYRDTESTESKAYIENIDSLSRRALAIHLTDLCEKQVEELILNKYKVVEPGAELLAGIVFKRTGGNPFYTIYLLNTFNQNKLIVKNDSGCWTWVMKSIEALPASSTPAEFIENRLDHITDNCKKILEFLACYGESCSTETIKSFVSSEPDSELDLAFLVKKGFLTKVSPRGTYLFAHDRIKCAAYDRLLNPEKISLIHWNIGRMLLDRGQSWIDRHITKVVSHFKKGLKHLDTPEMANKLIEMNIRAAHNARYSIAYSDGLSYATTALEIAENKQFIDRLPKNLRFNILLETARCAQLSKQFDLMDSYLFQIEEFADSIDVFRAVEIKISALVYQARYDDAWNIFRTAMKKINIRFPKKGSQVRDISEVLRTEVAMAKVGINNITSLKPCTDEEAIIATRLMAKLFPTMFLHRYDLIGVMTCKFTRLILKKGLTVETPFMLSVYATVLVGAMEKVKRGVQLGEVVNQLIQQEERETFWTYRTVAAITNNVLHHKYHWRDFNDLADKGFTRSLQFGDHEFAGFLIGSRCYFPYEAGEKLDTILDTVESYRDKVKPIKIDYVLDQYYRIYHRSCKLKTVPNKYRGAGNADFDSSLDILEETLADRPLTLYTTKMDHAMFAYVDDEIEKSFNISADIINDTAAPGASSESNIAFYTYLSGTRLLTENIPHSYKTRDIKRIMNRAFRRIEAFNAFEIGTNFHRYLTLQALKSAIRGQYAEADNYFVSAIKAAEEQNYLTDIGVIKELYGRFILRFHYTGPTEQITPEKRVKVARAKAKNVLLDAIKSYEDWGATLLSQKLLSRYQDIIETSDNTNVEQNISSGDYSQVLETIERISQVNGLNDCLEVLPKLFLDKVEGADHCIFLVQKKKNLHARSFKGILLNSKKQVINESASNFPPGIIELAKRRMDTGFIRDIRNEPDLSKDEFLKSEKVVSVYSIPIINQDELKGLIYIGSRKELNSSRNQRNLLQLMSSQAGGALVNAILMDGVRKSEHQLRTIYDSSTTGMVRVNYNGEIVTWNKTITDWVDVKPSYETEKLTVWNAPWAEALKIRELYRTFNAVQKLEGKARVSISVNNSPKHFNVSYKSNQTEEKNYLDYSIIDITESIEKREEMQNRQIAEQKVKASSEFIANMTHELRTPLAVIIGSAKRLLQSKNNLDPESKKALETSEANAQRLQKMVTDLLEFSRDNRNKSENKEAINLSMIAEAVCEDISKYVTERADRELRVSVEKNLIVDGQTNDFARILYNIIHNGFKFTDPKNGLIKVNLVNKSGRIILSISDNGVGIPDADKAHIFDRFYQATTNNETESGLGIGLSLVKKLVNINNGDIRLDSEVGKGTTFTIDFPQSLTLPSNEDVHTELQEEFVESEKAAFAREHRRQQSLDSRSPIMLISNNKVFGNEFSQLVESSYLPFVEDFIDGIHSIKSKPINCIYIDSDLSDRELKELHIVATDANKRLILIGQTSEEKAKEYDREHIVWPYTLEHINRSQFNESNKSNLVPDNKRSGEILIVDDEPDVRVMLTDFLSNSFHLRYAQDGLEAIEQVKLSRPSLILLDLKMPRMNGLDTLKVLRGEMNIDSKIIILTTNSDQDIKEEALRLGANDFCQKDVKLGELTARCTNLIDAYKDEKHINHLYSELKETHEELKAAEANLLLSEKNASIEHLGRTVLHELRTPLNSSVNSLQFIKSIVEDGIQDEDEAESFENSVHEALAMTDRMIDIVANFTEYASTNSNSEHTEESVKSVIEHAINLNNYDLANVDVNISNICDERILCDKSKILHVLSNLITNAKKAFIVAGRDEKQIDIETHLIGDKVRISFKDNGPGISEADQEKIFGMYFSRFKEQKTKSSGIGLHLANKILEEHGTTLSVESDGQSFTRFYFDLWKIGPEFVESKVDKVPEL